MAAVLAAAAVACESSLPGAPSRRVSPWPAAWAQLEEDVLELANAHRAAGATCGDTAYPPVHALTMQPQLREAARGHSRDMAVQNFFSHTSPDGRTFTQRIQAQGYEAFPMGENIAVTYPTAPAVIDAWMASPGHCANIMRETYHAIGVGYVFEEASTHRHYWTQSFGGR